MRKTLSKSLICAAIFVVVLSFMTVALAATPAITGITVDANAETGAVTVSGTITDAVAAQEATVIVVPKGTALSSVTDDQIKYIDQMTATDGTFSYTFKLDTTVKEYDVYFGGTGVESVGKDAITFGGGTITTHKIFGTFSLLAGAKYDNATAVAGTTSGTVAADGKYEIVVDNGTYTVVVGRPGYLYRTYSAVEVKDADKDLGAAALIAGDYTGDGAINLSDLQPVLSNFEKTSADAGYVAALDFNDDGVINLKDLQPILTNFEKSASTAY